MKNICNAIQFDSESQTISRIRLYACNAHNQFSNLNINNVKTQPFWLMDETKEDKNWATVVL